MAGYSGTPLSRKLGLKPDQRVAFSNAPAGFAATLGPLPAGTNLLAVSDAVQLDLIVLFAGHRAVLDASFADHARRLVPDGALWIAWPKRASGVATDLTDTIVRNTGLEQGLVDVKVCAIDEVWSGLKFVYRVKDRPALRAASATAPPRPAGSPTPSESQGG
ncbi:MAG: hypothetical protein U0794_20660 [Isosphaeraceae bacterium]